jgi:succinate dehydrogenase/fumarate reductase flavoprotein subunit
MIVDLLIEDGICAGATGITENGDRLVIRTPATVLATGGDAELYEHNVHPSCVTGDGYAMGLRAGASLMNMEFLQIFFCTPYPTKNLFHVFNGYELGRIYNKDGHAFLEDYLPEGITVQECVEENLRHAPFSTRDRASRYLAAAICKEIMAGRGSEQGGVFIDTPKPVDARDRAQMEFLMHRGIDPDGPTQLTMGFQCSNGGFRIDTQAMSTIPGVFAAGEAATGMHGADRLGGNMLANCLIFGAKAGRAALQWASKNQQSVPTDASVKQAMERIRAIEIRRGKRRPEELRKALQRTAWKHALVVRTETGLKEMLDELAELRSEFETSLDVSNPGDLIDALELDNLLLMGGVMAQTALSREESRGGHYREDFSDRMTDRPPNGCIVSLDAERKLKLDQRVIDPEWRDELADLGSGRWG